MLALLARSPQQTSWQDPCRKSPSENWLAKSPRKPSIQTSLSRSLPKISLIIRMGAVPHQSDTPEVRIRLKWHRAATESNLTCPRRQDRVHKRSQNSHSAIRQAQGDAQGPGQPFRARLLSKTKDEGAFVTGH